jgi:hypothetical protein
MCIYQSMARNMFLLVFICQLVYFPPPKAEVFAGKKHLVLIREPDGWARELTEFRMPIKPATQNTGTSSDLFAFFNMRQLGDCLSRAPNRSKLDAPGFIFLRSKVVLTRKGRTGHYAANSFSTCCDTKCCSAIPTCINPVCCPSNAKVCPNGKCTYSDRQYCPEDHTCAGTNNRGYIYNKTCCSKKSALGRCLLWNYVLYS